MRLITKAKQELCFAYQKISLFVISLMIGNSSIVPVFAKADSSKKSSTTTSTTPELLSTDNDLAFIKAICQAWAKWGLIFVIVAGWKYLKSKGDEKQSGVFKALFFGTLATWVLSLFDGALLFMIIDFAKYLAGIVAGQ